jgi:hypothetical protein
MIYQGSDFSSLFHVVSFFYLISCHTFYCTAFILSVVRRSPLYLDRDNFIFYQKGIALLSARYLCRAARSLTVPYDICRFEANSKAPLMGGQIPTSVGAIRQSLLLLPAPWISRIPVMSMMAC